MPMTNDDLLKNTAIIDELQTQMSNLNILLDTFIAEEERLPSGRNSKAIQHEIQLARAVQTEVIAFLNFLFQGKKSNTIYVAQYATYLSEAEASNSDKVTLLPAQKIFDFFKNNCRKTGNEMHLELALLRFDERYPRNTMDYLTDTIRVLFHYLDLLITFMTCRKQTMRQTSTPGASFFGKRHFIEPSTTTAIKEKLDEIFFNGKSTLSEKLCAMR